MIVTAYLFNPGGSHDRVTIDAGEVSMLVTGEKRNSAGGNESVVTITLRNGVQVTLVDRAMETSEKLRKGMNAT